MLPHSARTVRVLLTTCLSFSIALSALTPPPHCCAGEKSESRCCAAAPEACCCTSSDGSCGIACCTASPPAVPEYPSEPSKPRTDRLDAAEAPHNQLVLVGHSGCASALSALDVRAYCVQSSLQTLRVRLEI